jgi:D-inositol-3-phosphate glycosyltransferase
VISFVWSSKYPFLAGAGGSESYTVGHIRELTRRGIPTRILTLGHGKRDGRKDFPDITFHSLKNKEELNELDDTLVFITYPLNVRTKRPAYAILHCPPPTYSRGDVLYKGCDFKTKRLITTSRFATGMWRRYLKRITHMPTVYPFAEAAFSEVERPKRDKNSPTKVLFASRLTVDKGIYTLLAALHMEALAEAKFQLTVTTSGAHTEEGKVLLRQLQAHPYIKVVPARRDPKSMAKLMAAHDVVVMPSTNIFWQEMFGVVSVEAQHAGCRVVASRSGGLPETNCGGLILSKPDDPKALAASMARAIELGPLTAAERRLAIHQFTLKSSVDDLLKAIGQAPKKPRRTMPLRKGQAPVYRWGYQSDLYRARKITHARQA